MDGPTYFLAIFFACMWYMGKSPDGPVSVSEGIAITSGVLALGASLVLAFITYF